MIQLMLYKNIMTKEEADKAREDVWAKQRGEDSRNKLMLAACKFMDLRQATIFFAQLRHYARWLKECKDEKEKTKAVEQSDQKVKSTRSKLR